MAGTITCGQRSARRSRRSGDSSSRASTSLSVASPRSRSSWSKREKTVPKALYFAK